MKYHINSFRKETRTLEVFTSGNDTTSTQDTIGKAVSDIEISSILKHIITE